MNTNICVMLCTRQRPKMLRNCMLSLLPQLDQADCGDMLVVIENDTAPTCESLVRELGTAFPSVSVSYLHEPELGIPFARNRGVAFGIEKGAAWLAFIDDDERAEPGWLNAMRHAASTLDADALSGPVTFLLPDVLPTWLAPPKNKRHSRGKRLRTAATNNTMVRTHWLMTQGTGLRFDERMRFTGGSDKDFFIRFATAGGRILWVDDAIVSEEVAPERLTMDWNLERARSVAASTVISHKNRNGLSRALLRCIPKALGRLVRGAYLVGSGSLLWVVARREGGRQIYQGRKAMNSAVGSFQGAFGRHFQPYRKIVGS